jgi:hypothetical protein
VATVPRPARVAEPVEVPGRQRETAGHQAVLAEAAARPEGPVHQEAPLAAQPAGVAGYRCEPTGGDGVAERP